MKETELQIPVPIPYLCQGFLWYLTFYPTIPLGDLVAVPRQTEGCSYYGLDQAPLQNHKGNATTPAKSWAKKWTSATEEAVIRRKTHNSWGTLLVASAAFAWSSLPLLFSWSISRSYSSICFANDQCNCSSSSSSSSAPSYETLSWLIPPRETWEIPRWIPREDTIKLTSCSSRSICSLNDFSWKEGVAMVTVWVIPNDIDNLTITCCSTSLFKVLKSFCFSQSEW